MDPTELAMSKLKPITRKVRRVNPVHFADAQSESFTDLEARIQANLESMPGMTEQEQRMYANGFCDGMKVGMDKIVKVVNDTLRK